MEIITGMTATEIAKRTRAKSLSVVDVVSAHLARINELNPEINAVSELMTEQALADAENADANLGDGPLFGYLVAVVDAVVA